jgi:hypothetical protein
LCCKRSGHEYQRHDQQLSEKGCFHKKDFGFE